MTAPRVDVLLPTYNRPSSFLATLSGVAAQTLSDLRVIVADQSEHPVQADPVAQSVARVISARGGSVEWHHRSPVHGIAEQRDFLLRHAQANAVLFLDDDVFMEPWVVERLLAALEEQKCAFVGAFPAGLTHRDDVRPMEQGIDFWEDGVRPEALEPGSAAWEKRWPLHQAANLWHVARRLETGERRLYKVAWIASCVLYDRRKALDVGGFSFWKRLPRYHSGEEVLLQNLLMRRWGGCGLVPSGTYHTQLPSTVLNAAGTVDGHALELLPGLAARAFAAA